MILHIARGDRWRGALVSGTYDCIVIDGAPFIHCSTGRQVRTPWRTLSADAADHVYGPIPVAAVVAAEPLTPGMATADALPPRIARMLMAARGDSPPGIDEGVAPSDIYGLD
jgi:uncharacterized protein (DUF952 family)